MALDLATIAAPPARDETPARPGPAKESAAVLERAASISWLLLWAAGNLGLQTIAVGERGDDTALAACRSILYRVCYDPPQ